MPILSIWYWNEYVRSLFLPILLVLMAKILSKVLLKLVDLIILLCAWLSCTEANPGKLFITIDLDTNLLEILLLLDE